MDNKRLYIGGLAWGMGDDDLTSTFSKAGTVVSAHVIMDKFSGRSKGFGFVEMDTDDEAQAAIDMFNDQEIMGRNVIVNIARPKEERPPRY